jgi:hypothetical protein
MKESTFYQAILQEGELERIRKDIRRVGERKFKSFLPAQVQTTIENISNLAQLEQVLDRILDVESWDELLAPVAAQPTRKRRKRQ